MNKTKWFIVFGVFCFAAVAGVEARNVDTLVDDAAKVDSAFAGSVPDASKFNVPDPIAIIGGVVRAATDDFFPLKKGRKLVYEYTTSESDQKSYVTLEFTDVTESAEGQAASVRLTVNKKGMVKPLVFTVLKTGKSVLAFDFIRGAKRDEFPVPLEVGKKWDSQAGVEEITTLLGRVQVPAGTFYSCLKVVTRIGDGDAGTATRYYAPSVGLVYEEVSAEDMQSTVKLMKVIN